MLVSVIHIRMDGAKRNPSSPFGTASHFPATLLPLCLTKLFSGSFASAREKLWALVLFAVDCAGAMGYICACPWGGRDNLRSSEYIGIWPFWISSHICL